MVMVLFYMVRKLKGLESYLRSPKLPASSEKNESGYNNSQQIKWVLRKNILNRYGRMFWGTMNNSRTI